MDDHGFSELIGDDDNEDNGSCGEDTSDARVRRKRDEDDEEYLQHLLLMLARGKREVDDAPVEPAAKRPHRRMVFERPDYSASEYGQLLKCVKAQDETGRDRKLFRDTIRIPYDMFESICDTCRLEAWFPHGDTDASGRPCAPLELKILCVFSKLAAGASGFDNACARCLIAEPQ